MNDFTEIEQLREKIKKNRIKASITAVVLLPIFYVLVLLQFKLAQTKFYVVIYPALIVTFIIMLKLSKSKVDTSNSTATEKKVNIDNEEDATLPQKIAAAIGGVCILEFFFSIFIHVIVKDASSDLSVPSGFRIIFQTFLPLVDSIVASALIFRSSDKDKYTNMLIDFNEKIINQQVNRIFKDAKYSREGFRDSSVIARLRLIRIGNIYRSNDLIEGEYQDVKFQSADTYIAQETSSSDGSYTDVFFNGKWFIIKNNQKYSGNAIICDEKLNNKILKSYRGGNFDRKKPYDHFDVVEKNIPELKDCKTYISMVDDISNELPTKVINLYKRIKKIENRQVLLAVLYNEIHILVDSRGDKLEPSNKIFSKNNEEKIAKEVTEELEFIRKIVECTSIKE